MCFIREDTIFAPCKNPLDEVESAVIAIICSGDGFPHGLHRFWRLWRIGLFHPYQGAETVGAWLGFWNMFHALPSHGEGDHAWEGCGERGTVQLVDLEERVATRHPLRKIRRVVAGRVPEFPALYPEFARPSIAPERLLRASLIQLLVSARSERQVTAQAQHDIFLATPPDDDPGSPARLESLPKIGPNHS